ncbi:MAG: hypothetical protein K6U89_18605, partial [Chloroflexi bacterium]|nr:hypothetical protein [Chloroflexota bacterium]
RIQSSVTGVSGIAFSGTNSFGENAQPNGGLYTEQDPPGIPIICPGERATPEVAAHLDVVRRAGLRVSGPADPSLETLRVL